ncbi:MULTISPECIES: MFS transporter [unclassified Beijerinckia]|uniref:MFS transporter n=1 Tax=unclassified Beijerinckia TaxID=2638183 RepID=UPI0008997974|nr:MULTISPECIES: MFS transporter [unclassified Beijerinckia]MDH7794829.1 MFS family permease [Beijerinckia sp. GAS462]SEB76813.1 Predicted arabinose efflux permease, MFS family [Beijerinckia sp. 28-YEA-48]
MSAIVHPDTAYRHVLALTGALFLSYLTVAMSLPAVSIYVVNGLHLNNAYGGLAVGIAFLSTIVTRGQSGIITDRIGGKLAMQRGLVLYAVAGVICLLASLPQLPVAGRYAVLIAGRLLLGLGESLAMVGMVSWAIGLMGHGRSGQVLSLVGMGMYGAFAAGGPLGLALLDRIGFGGLMGICATLPLLGLIGIHWLPAVAPQAGQREPFWRIIGRIWRAGAAVGLQGVGFATLGAFFALYFLSRGWPYAGLGLTCFGVGFVAVRLFCGHLPDRIGGTRVAIVSLIVEACGQYLLWLAPGPERALVGALLTGLGCSMVFPAMGSEVVKQVPPHLRGTAVGGFAAFQDLAYGATGPVVGVLADVSGYPSVFLIGGLAATLGVWMAMGVRKMTAQP